MLTQISVIDDVSVPFCAISVPFCPHAGRAEGAVQPQGVSGSCRSALLSVRSLLSCSLAEAKGEGID